MIHICNFRSKVKDFIDTTSRSKTWSKYLSPFFLGPVDLYAGHKSRNVENAWQYSKVYPEHADAEGNPTQAYFDWAAAGWAKDYADRYPMGKGRKPLYSWWDGEKLGYVEARKRIYCPLYAKAVEGTESFRKLKEVYAEKGEIWLWDFDGYDHHKLGWSYQQCLDCDTKKMGHAFVLAMMLDGQRLWEKKDESSSVPVDQTP